MSRTTMAFFLLGIILLIYGYLCRLVSIYFFGDSKPFGWMLIAAGLLGLLIDLRKRRLAQRRNILGVRIIIGIVITAFAIVGGASLLIKTSTIYQSAIGLIEIDGDIKSEIGDVRGIGLFPTGSEIIIIANGATDRSASFVVTVRGEKAHRDVKVNLAGSAQTGWQVSSVKMIYM